MRALQAGARASNRSISFERCFDFQTNTNLLATICQRCCGAMKRTILLDDFLTNLHVLKEVATAYNLDNLAFAIENTQNTLS